MLALLFSRACLGQREDRGKWRLTTQPLQFMLLDFPVNAEMVFKNLAVGATIGYRVAAGDKFDFSTGTGDDKISSEYLEGKSQALTFGVNAKHFFNSRNGWYYETQLFYRRWWRREALDNFYPAGTYESIFRTYGKDVIGSKFLIGYSEMLSDKGKIRPVLNGYAGLGFRGYIRQNQLISKLPGEQASVYTYHESGVGPSIHLGLSIGMAFFQQNKVITE